MSSYLPLTSFIKCLNSYIISSFPPQEPSDRYSESSAGSRRHRLIDRGTSEVLEEVPHLSDIATSPDVSPHQGRRLYVDQVQQFHEFHEQDEHYREGQNIVRVHQRRHEGRTEFRSGGGGEALEWPRERPRGPK